MKKKIFAMMLSAAVLCGTAAAGWTAQADLRPDIDVVIDGTERTFYNANGTEGHAISYQDTTYLPVRAIGELLGKTVGSDQRDGKTTFVDLLGLEDCEALVAQETAKAKAAISDLPGCEFLLNLAERLADRRN